MVYETTLAIVTFLQVLLALIHAFRSRSRSDAWFLFLTAVGFGYVFPLVTINILGLYRFSGQLTLFQIPFYLGLGWYSLFYIAFCLAEILLKGDPDKRPVRFAILCGVIFGIMEAQWDPTLLDLGLMTFNFPSFAIYPLNFTPGFPMAHAFFGFAYAYAFVILRKKREGKTAPIALALGSMLAFPLIMMLFIPQFGELCEKVRPSMTNEGLVVVDMVHLTTTYIGLGFLFALWIRFLSRRLEESKGQQ